MTEPPTHLEHAPPDTDTLTRESRVTWWQRNRLALLLLVPLLLLAGLAASFRYFTLYRPNEFTRPQRASGQTLTYHETFRSIGFGTAPKQYGRTVTLTLKSLKATPEFQGEQAAGGATLWVTEMHFQASPDVPLEGCSLALIDSEGVVYDDRSGKTGLSTDPQRSCVPEDTPGPTFDFTGELVNPDGPARPGTWTVRRTVAMPEGKQPGFVRVAWREPGYALIPFK